MGVTQGFPALAAMMWPGESFVEVLLTAGFAGCRRLEVTPRCGVTVAAMGFFSVGGVWQKEILIGAFVRRQSTLVSAGFLTGNEKYLYPVK